MKMIKDITEQNKQYFSSWSSNYDWKLFQFWMKRFQKPIVKILDQTRPATLLDISCGTGEFLKELTQLKPKYTLYGADITQGMLDKARKKLPPSIHLSLADVHHLPFKDNYFDYVTNTEAFHHFENQTKALQEMVRITKKNGKMIIVDINFFFRSIHYLFEKLEPGCVKVNSKKEMRQLFEDAGLKNITQQRNFLFAVMTIGEKNTGRRRLI